MSAVFERKVLLMSLQSWSVRWRRPQLSEESNEKTGNIAVGIFLCLSKVLFGSVFDESFGR